MKDVLVLNVDYNPFHVISWERAVCLMMEDRVRLVDQAVDSNGDDKFVGTVNSQVPRPSVVALKEYVSEIGTVRFKRQNIFARDRYSCAYCGLQPTKCDGSPDIGKLTLDHVVPRCRSFEIVKMRGTMTFVTLPWNDRLVPVTGWRNTVTACKKCNAEKADRTPEEAGMVSQRPKRPNARESMCIVLKRVDVPIQWKAHLA